MEKIRRVGQDIDDSMAHVHCILDASGYKFTYVVCYTYCFSTATIVARNRLNFTLYVHCLSCTALKIFISFIIVSLYEYKIQFSFVCKTFSMYTTTERTRAVI